MTIVGNHTISLGDQAARIAGCHYAVGTNALQYRVVPPGWFSALSFASTGRNDSNYPTTAVIDGDLLNNWTQPSAAVLGASEVHLLFELVVGTDDAHSIDTVMIKPTNWDDIPNIQVQVRAASDSTFTTFTGLPTDGKLTNVIAWPHTQKLIIENLIDDAFVTFPGVTWTGIRYLAISLTLSSGTFAVLPAISEIVCGKRRQFAHKPRLPHAPNPMVSGSNDFIAKNRSMGRDVNFMGAKDLNVRMKPHADNFYGITDEVAEMDAFFADINYGLNPFLWVDEPGTGSSTDHDEFGNGIWAWLPDSSMAQQYVNQRAAEVELSMRELPPFQISEV